MGTGIGYRNARARARMEDRYGTGKICTCLTSLIKTIGGEFSDRQRNANHNYAYTRQQLILSRDSSWTTALSSVSCIVLWRRQDTETRITIIVWLPYPIPVPVVYSVQCIPYTLQLHALYTCKMLTVNCTLLAWHLSSKLKTGYRYENQFCNPGFTFGVIGSFVDINIFVMKYYFIPFLHMFHFLNLLNQNLYKC